VTSDIIIHDTKEGTNDSNSKRKQRPQWVMTAADYDGDNDEKADDSSVGHVVTVTCSGKRQAHLPTYHFERLLEEACPNHAYPIKHDLKDYYTVKNFIISGSLTRGMELDEDPSESDTIPFPGEDTVKTVYDGRPH
jgi:hypothetical protein